MRRAMALCLLVMCALMARPAAAQDAHQWVTGSPVQTRLVVGQNGETYVGVFIHAPPSQAVPVARSPMAVSLVVDTSGSMAGEKILHARMAASSLLESLNDGDIVSIYGFSNVVTEHAAPTVISRATRPSLMQQVNAMYAQGGTNLYGGMQAGISRVSNAPPSHALRRVFLISDGHANVGPSDPAALGNLAAGATEWGTSVTAIGVGIDYDQSTLTALAVRSSGRLYHLSQPQQLAFILEQELNLLTRSVAVNAVLEIQPGPGITILEGATLGTTLENGRLVLPLGAVYADQEREVLFRVRVDTGQLGRHSLARATLRFQRPGDERAHLEAAPIDYVVTNDAAQASQSRAPRVAALIAQHQASQAQFRARDMLLAGNSGGAAQELERARAQLDAAAAEAPDDAPSSVALRQRAQRLEHASQRAREATSAPAAREAGYDFADEAASAEGF